MLAVEPFRRAGCDEELTAPSTPPRHLRASAKSSHRRTSRRKLIARPYHPGSQIPFRRCKVGENFPPSTEPHRCAIRSLFCRCNGCRFLCPNKHVVDGAHFPPRIPLHRCKLKKSLKPHSVTDSKLNVNAYPYCLIHSSSAQTGFWDRSFGFGARAKLTRIVFPNSSLLFILSTAAKASDSNSNSMNPKPLCLFTSKSNGIRTSTMSPNEMDYMKEKTVDDLSSTQHKIRISLTSRNVPALEKTCQELMNSARDKNVMPRGPVRYPTKTLRITCRKTPCGEGSKTWDRFQMRIHKRSIHFRSTSDVLKQITSVSVEPGVDIQSCPVLVFTKLFIWLLRFLPLRNFLRQRISLFNDVL
ncbi:40S ribosomal protein S20 [Trichinella spiralis]|uniref:40S ribosomal protein S20 n=1 Tax=Trichinella spiralis TaxID=6334 RepID=UPI0001EFBBC7|nr:40S ribosomal protein S20 [Trichinella spiralis]